MRLLAFIGFLAIAAVIAAAVYFFGGFYNVAGTSEDPGIVNWTLVRVRTASIERHANDTPPANLADPAMVQAGAHEFKEHGCVLCHGAPGVKWAKFSEGLHPDPPDPKEVVGELSPPQLFWVIKNGINMTAMPSFAQAGASDEDIWKIVAFLKKWTSVSEADYKNWTAELESAPASEPPAASAPSAPPSAPENKQ